jgi:hypothetical protein
MVPVTFGFDRRSKQIAQSHSDERHCLLTNIALIPATCPTQFSYDQRFYVAALFRYETAVKARYRTRSTGVKYRLFIKPQAKPFRL